ncbi:MAG: M23 family metallopeptidase [Bacteroidales bacterium]|jgi:murein DD-endopeptidase MepM/ murein hydrolase activator NlpD|nr:M23 family metallopeptidase [Bacteroidales bacterium]
MATEKKKHIVNKLKHKYRLIIYNDNTFEEVWYMRLSRLNVFTFVGTGLFLLIVLVTVLIAFTPIREFIPGYPDGNMRRNIVNNVHKLDSLEHELEIRDRYFASINRIIRGEVPLSYENENDSVVRYEDISFTKSEHDSILRQQIEEEELFNLSVLTSPGQKTDFSTIHFFPPVKGIITSSFNPGENHFGTDIVAATNKVVVATLSGTVILANWTLETGYVIQIQHDNNLVSIYKHNSELLKKVGNHVTAGETIAIIGNSGELTSGPHLHFELWHNGTPINPEDFISF